MNNPRLQSRLRETDSTCILELSGEIDLDSAPAFRSILSDAVSNNPSHLVLNLSGVRYVDSSGFAAIMGTAKALRSAGGRISLVGCNDHVQRIVKLMRLDADFSLFATEEEALQAERSRTA